jgi:WD40 repeat protein
LDESLKSVGQWPNELKINSLKNYKEHFISISGPKISIIDLNDPYDITLLQQYNFENNISSFSSVFEDSKIALGFDNGNFCIFDLQKNQIIILNKTHKTKITGCHVIKAKDKSVVVTTGMDSQIKIFSGFGNDWMDKKFSLVDNISNHTSWINDSELDHTKTNLLTASADGTVRFWPLDPETFLNH